MSAHQPGGPIRVRRPFAPWMSKRKCQRPPGPRTTPIPWMPRRGALEPAAGHPWTGGVRVLVRAGSEKCRDVKPYDVMCPAQLRVNHRWGAWWSGAAS